MLYKHISFRYLLYCNGLEQKVQYLQDMPVNHFPNISYDLAYKQVLKTSLSPEKTPGYWLVATFRTLGYLHVISRK